MRRFMIWYLSLVKYADVAELAASSPKRSRWEKKWGDDGAAVKILQRPKLKKNFGNRKSHAHATVEVETN